MASRIPQLVVSSVLLAAGIGTLPQSHAAGEDDITPVFVAQNCDSDLVGQRIVFKLKEAIRRSTRFKVVPSYQDSLLMVNVVCLDPDDDERGLISHFAYTITAMNATWKYDFVLAMSANRCGSDRIDVCAEGIVAHLDGKLDELHEAIRALPKD